MTLPDPIQLAVPFFVACIFAELWLAARIDRRADRSGPISGYETRDTAASLVMGFGNSIVLALSAGVIFAALEAARAFRVFEIGWSWWAFVLLFFAEDLAYYWFHRLSHERRIWWAAHVNHHSSQHYNLSTALRQPWTGTVAMTWVPWLPLAFIGFPPEMIVFQKALNLVYQFWIHTELIDRLPNWFEAAFNTPSHHRVHHAINPRYLDANYAGTLIIWDRIFGTFVPEDRAEPCRYGTVRPIASFNPITIAFHEWRAIWRDIKSVSDWRARWMYVFGPPGWSHDGSRKTSEMLRAEWRAQNEP